MVSFGKKKKALWDDLNPNLNTLRSFFELKFIVRKQIKNPITLIWGLVTKEFEDQGIC
jgi:hypothetical protein